MILNQKKEQSQITLYLQEIQKEEIDKKTRDIFALTNRGVIATFTNLPAFIKDIKKEI